MEWLVLLLTGGATGSYAAWRARALLRARRDRAEDADLARCLARDDVTLLGEEICALDATPRGRRPDRRARRDLQRALDAYEQARRLADRLSGPDDVDRLVRLLAAGRHAVARARARAEGRPLPGRRPPCFFNPAHGPSDHEVLWTPRGRGTRSVPACTRCASRLAAGTAPETRMIAVGERRVPYWAAGEKRTFEHGRRSGDLGPDLFVAWVWDSPRWLEHPRHGG